MRRIVYLAGVFCCVLVGLWLASARPPAPVLIEEEAARRPSEWGWVQRTFPHFQADADAYRNAFEEAQALKAASKTNAFGMWELAGPTNIGGRIVDVAFDPQTPSTIYAAAATGGVFKSTNSGGTWRPIFDEQPVLTIGDIAVDPSNPQVIYVGTGEANGGHNNFAGAGLYKSTDGGATWAFSGLENTTSIARILVHPANPQRVYVAAVGSYFAPNPERGIFRSDDGGATWQKVLFVNDTTGAVDLVMRPDAPDVLFSAMWQRIRRVSGAQLSGRDSGIFTSTDGGDTWTQLGPETGLPGGAAGRIGLALCRDVPGTMYALYNNGSTYTGLYRTDDGGQSWRTVDQEQTIASGTAGFSWYFGQVRVHPEDPDLVFALDVQFMRSTNGGDAFAPLTTPHVDHHALAFHPTDPSFVIMGNDGGLALSQNRGANWSDVDNLPITQFYEIGIDPSNPDHLYGGTQDNGTLRTSSDDAAEPWNRIFGGDGFYVIIDPTDPHIVYAESQRGALGKSVDGGFSFRNATLGIPSEEPTNWSTPVVIDPSNPEVLYYGTNRVYRTTNRADTWERVSDILTDQPPQELLGTITTIAVAPTDADVIYAGTDDGHVWVTDDYGTSWRDVSGSLPRRWVTRVVVDPADDRVAYATFSGLRWREPQPHVFRTTDRGATWQDISSNLPDAPVNAFAIDPLNANLLFVGSDIGAFVSTDGGGHWETLGEGLPAVSVYDMKVHLDETRHFLVAGTHGRSMYTLDLTNAPVAIEEETLPETFALEPAFPNPFRTRTTLRYDLPDTATARLEIYDLLGRRIATLADGKVGAGRHIAIWEATDGAGHPVAAGSYVARLSAGGKTVRSVLLRIVR